MTLKKQQEGAVLLVAVVLLLVISVLGISAVKSSSTKTQVAGNSIFSMQVYQGVESTIAKSASDNNWHNVDLALNAAGASYVVPAADLPDETINSGGVLTSTAVVNYISMLDKKDCPPNMPPMSSEMKCKIFSIDARTRLQSTNARDHHIQSVAGVSP